MAAAATPEHKRIRRLINGRASVSIIRLFFWVACAPGAQQFPAVPRLGAEEAHRLLILALDKAKDGDEVDRRYVTIYTPVFNYSSVFSKSPPWERGMVGGWAVVVGVGRWGRGHP